MASTGARLNLSTYVHTKLTSDLQVGLQAQPVLDLTSGN